MFFCLGLKTFGKVKHVRVLFHAQLCASDLMTCSRMLESQKGLGEEDYERKNISKHDDPVWDLNQRTKNITIEPTKHSNMKNRLEISGISPWCHVVHPIPMDRSHFEGWPAFLVGIGRPTLRGWSTGATSWCHNPVAFHRSSSWAKKRNEPEKLWCYTNGVDRLWYSCNILDNYGMDWNGVYIYIYIYIYILSTLLLLLLLFHYHYL